MAAKRSRTPDEGRRWLWKLLVCPRCGRALSAAQNLVRCAACGPYPMLGDVPLLVKDPAGYCAAYFDAILASLAEVGLATPEAVMVVRAFAQGAPAEPERFSDDWTVAERQGEAPPEPVRGPASQALASLFATAATAGLAAWVERHVGRPALAVELGCGAGERSEVLGQRARRLVVADLSLRAVLQSRARAMRGLADVAGVVCDAAALPFKDAGLDLVVAENVIDLLEDPLALLTELRRTLGPKGRALVTSPDPGLGSSDAEAVKDLASVAKLRVVERRDGLPWLRRNSARFLEVYLAQALVLRAG